MAGSAETSDAQLREGDVLVLGAGFSSALTDKAPTMKGFLVASAATGALAPEYVDLGRALNQFFGLKLGDINIEELATFLVDEFRTDRSYHPHGAYDELIRVITDTLAKAWDGAKESASLHLARAMASICVEKHVPVLTLN